MWAKNIVHICMNISAGEKVLLVTDQAMAQMRERLMAEILTANPGQVWTYVLSDAQRPLVEYPPLLHHRLHQSRRHHQKQRPLWSRTPRHRRRPILHHSLL